MRSCSSAPAWASSQQPPRRPQLPRRLPPRRPPWPRPRPPWRWPCWACRPPLLLLPRAWPCPCPRPCCSWARGAWERPPPPLPSGRPRRRRCPPPCPRPCPSAVRPSPKSWAPGEARAPPAGAVRTTRGSGSKGTAPSGQPAILVAQCCMLRVKLGRGQHRLPAQQQRQCSCRLARTFLAGLAAAACSDGWSSAAGCCSAAAGASAACSGCSACGAAAGAAASCASMAARPSRVSGRSPRSAAPPRRAAVKQARCARAPACKCKVAVIPPRAWGA